MVPTAGFKPNAAGLYVPEEHARAREVWTFDEWRAIEKASKLLKGRALALVFRCEAPACPDPTIRREPLLGGEIRLRCGCKDRIFTRHV
ncbi:MAG TPA: hypothetical protein VEC57_14870 [Candidatus Limnocylindrales bacterium]|nr:hypothetical protein [Candidatus Limnocylindrales bacterium]